MVCAFSIFLFRADAERDRDSYIQIKAKETGIATDK